MESSPKHIVPSIKSKCSCPQFGHLVGGMCYMNARHWGAKLQKEDRADVYWVK